jgi:hypothetical protein
MAAVLLVTGSGCGDRRSESIQAGASVQPERPVVEPLLEPGESVSFSHEDPEANVLIVDESGSYVWESALIDRKYRQGFTGVGIDWTVSWDTDAANVDVRSGDFVEPADGFVLRITIAVAEIKAPPLRLDISVNGSPVIYDESEYEGKDE